LLTTGEDLRIIAGESRLKEKARERVALALQYEGLLAIPEVPSFQDHEVYVTSLNSDLSLLFLALLNPSDDNLERRVLPAVGPAAEEAGRWDGVEELGELLDEARRLVTKIEGGAEE
jgi:hypothetical protein